VSAVESPWVVRWTRPVQPRLRLYCLGRAGAGATPFRAWETLVGPGVELCAVRLPGRENRVREEPVTSAAAVVEELSPVVVDGAETPFALFGHCFGGLVMFELARALRRQGLPSPVALFVGEQIAPATAGPPGDGELTRDDLLRRLEELGGTDAKLLGSEEFLALMEPALRADFRLADTYAYEPEPPLDTPISVLGSAERTEVDALVAWRAETTRAFTLRLLHGEDLLPEIGRAVAAELELVLR
jgi:medium-chain acyl-[acyl-carrier-protein] hydrolase